MNQVIRRLLLKLALLVWLLLGTALILYVGFEWYSPRGRGVVGVFVLALAAEAIWLTAGVVGYVELCRRILPDER